MENKHADKLNDVSGVDPIFVEIWISESELWMNSELGERAWEKEREENWEIEREVGRWKKEIWMVVYFNIIFPR